jgi:hypothetical protein
MGKRINTGGSQGEPVRGSGLPYFHHGVKAVEFNLKNIYEGRILPAFERDASGVPVSLQSVVPYRLRGLAGPDGREPFSDFYYTLQLHKWVGSVGKSFVSPLTEHQAAARGIDPLQDCFVFAKRNKEQHPDWFALTERPKGAKESALLNSVRNGFVFNSLMSSDGNSATTKLCVITGAAGDSLKEDLDVLCSRKDNPNDPNWGDYLLGDVTCPTYGLKFRASATAMKAKKGEDPGKSAFQTSMLHFTREKDRLIGAERFPFDINTPEGQEILASRYDIPDAEHVVKIWSAEEILQFIVDDGFLPHELIVEACSPNWDVPRPQPKRTIITGSAEPEQEVDDVNTEPTRTFRRSSTPAPVAQPAAAAPQPTVAPAPAKASERKFWVFELSSGRVGSATVTEDAVQSMADGVNLDEHARLMLEGTTDWCLPSAFGFKPPTPPPAPPAPPMPPAPPAPPAPPMPPAPPAGMPKPVQPAAPPACMPKPVQPAAMHKSIAPPVAAAPAPVAPSAPPAPPVAATPVVCDKSSSAPPLTPEESAELAQLEDAWNRSAEANTPMEATRLQRFMTLNQKAHAWLKSQK